MHAVFLIKYIHNVLCWLTCWRRLLHMTLSRHPSLLHLQVKDF